jgi:hypothetical protein
MSEQHVPLLPFHLGALDDDALDAVEVHLLACRDCTKGYLALKRQFDSAAAFDERPSARARERLRAEMSRRLRSRLPRPRFWAAGAALAAVLLLFLWLRNHPANVSSPVHETLIDTSTHNPPSQVL